MDARRLLPNRPPRLTEVAAVVALMAVLTIGVAWYRQSHRPPVPAAATTTTTEARSRQPLVSFHVFAGCGTAPDVVKLNGTQTDMPANVFDHQLTQIEVDADGSSGHVWVQVDAGGRPVVRVGEGKFFANSLYVAVGALGLC